MIQHAEVIRRLEREVELNGSLRRAASAIRVSPQYLRYVLDGKRNIGPKLLKRLGLRRRRQVVFVYEATRRA